MTENEIINSKEVQYYENLYRGDTRNEYIYKDVRNKRMHKTVIRALTFISAIIPIVVVAITTLAKIFS